MSLLRAFPQKKDSRGHRSKEAFVTLNPRRPQPHLSGSSNQPCITHYPGFSLSQASTGRSSAQNDSQSFPHRWQCSSPVYISSSGLPDYNCNLEDVCLNVSCLGSRHLLVRNCTEAAGGPKRGRSTISGRVISFPKQVFGDFFWGERFDV